MPSKRKSIKSSTKTNISEANLKRRNMVVTLLVGITVVLSFVLELPQKISNSVEIIFPVKTQITLEFPTATSSEALIIVSSFDDRSAGQAIGIDPAQYIYEKLRDQVYNDKLPIRVERLYQTVDENTAKSVGQAYGATILLWGWYDALTITPRLERIRVANEIVPTQEGARFSITDSDKIELTITSDLPSYSTYIVLFTLGIDRYGAGELNDALLYFGGALKSIPSQAQFSFNPSEVYFYLSGIYYQKQEYESALEDVQKYLQYNKDSSIGYIMRGIIYSKMQNYSLSLADFTYSISIDRSSAETYYNRGVYYSIRGEYGNAILDYSRAIDLRENYAIALLSRGAAYRGINDLEHAMSDFNSIIQIQPKYVPAYSNRGATYADMGQFQLALSDFNKAIELDPSFANNYYNRGTLWLNQGDTTRAIDDFNKALRFDPNNSDAYYNRGVAYYRSKLYVEAINDYTSAIELSANLVAAYSSRAFAYLAQNQIELAVADFNMVIQIGSDSILTDTAKKALENLNQK